MAKDSRFDVVSSQSPLMRYVPGTLNPFRVPDFENQVARLKGPHGVASADGPSMMKQIFLENALQHDGSSIALTPCIGLCFRVDQGDARAGGKIKAHSWISTALEGGGVMMPKGTIIQLKVWIPELWSAKVPEKMGDVLGDHHEDIDRLPSFYCLKRDIPTPRPGQLVEVMFADPKDVDLGGTYLGLFSDEAGIPSIMSMASPKDALDKKCKNLGPVGGVDPPIIGDNMSVGSVGPPLPIAGIASGTNLPSSAFGNKASCRGTHRRWFAALEKYGLVNAEGSTSFTHYEKFPANGSYEAEYRDSTGRETIIYFPQRTDYFEFSPEIMFFFHDSGGFTDMDFERIAKAMKELNSQRRNYIFVVTELPWSRGLSPNQRAKSTNYPEAAFSGTSEAADSIADPGHWAEYEKQVMEVINSYAWVWSVVADDPGEGPVPGITARKTFIAVGAGGTALRNAVTWTDGKPYKIIMAHADHLVFGNVGTISDNYVKDSNTFMFVITKGASANPLTIHSVEHLKTKGIKGADSVGVLETNGKYGLIGYPDYETVVKNAIAYRNEKIPGFKQDVFPTTAEDKNPGTIEPHEQKPKVPATQGQGANVEHPTTPTEPEIPPEIKALLEQKIQKENAIKAEKAKVYASLNKGEYTQADKSSAVIKEAKAKIVELDKKIAELKKTYEPKAKTTDEEVSSPPCPDLHVIGTVSDVVNETQKEVNVKPWEPFEYKVSSFL